MQHITQTTRFGYWDQAIKKWEASKINLKELQQCGSCYTRVKTPGMCEYCQNYEDKIVLLKMLAPLVLDDSRAKRKKVEIPHPHSPFKPAIYCEVCGLDPKGRGIKQDNNYLHFEEKTICHKCKMGRW